MPNGNQIHNPNPFYFVPFVEEGPFTFDESRWTGNPRYSGRLTVKLTPKTPLHIVGHQTGNGRRIMKSHFYRQDGVPCIPGSSIRGMLRAFVEALTNGWVSQVNETYDKVPGINGEKHGRHIGYDVFEEYKYSYTSGPKIGRTTPASPPAIPPAFRPVAKNGKFDIATWLFGMVEGDGGKFAIGGRVRVEDACLPNGIELNDGNLPDICGVLTNGRLGLKDAFMGGAKPFASSWWYFLPEKVRPRPVKKVRQGRVIATDYAEFVGSRFRGRKFYFHQKPENCVKWYADNWGNLHELKKKKTNQDGTQTTSLVKPAVYQYPVECVGTETPCKFDIYVSDIPKPLLHLLLLAIEPGGVIRHKLGYGKPYGFGSIDMKITEARLREVKPGSWPVPSLNVDAAKNLGNSILQELRGVTPPSSSVWGDSHLTSCGVQDLIHRPSLEVLARILGWDSQNLCFTYPPFKETQFSETLLWNYVNGVLSKPPLSQKITNRSFVVNAVIGAKVAETLFPVKHTIDLSVYQEKANGWTSIKSRKP